MKYSVIIPIYKAESTIERCLRSLLAQQLDDTEILLINDGSPDNSGAICEKYETEYPCIRYFRKENGGVSTARNLGLENARGEYILFVDSDDYVNDDYFRIVDSIIDVKKPDMLIWGYRTDNSDETYCTGEFSAFSSVAVARYASPLLRRNAFSSLWCRSFRRDIIEKYGIRFSEKLNIAEDINFILAYILRAKSLISINNALYVQCVDNDQSLSRKRRNDLKNDLLAADKLMINELHSTDIEPNVCCEYNAAVTWLYYRSAYSSCKELLKYDLSRRERRKKIREICHLFSREHIKPADWKCRVIALPVKLKLTFVIDYLIRR